MKRFSVLLAGLLVLAVNGASAKVYTLDECIRMAVETDPTLVQSRNSVKTAKALVWSQAGQFLPSLSLSYGSSETHRGPLSLEAGDISDPSYTRSVISKSYSAGFSLGENLFNGLSNVWDYLGSRAAMHGTERDYIQTRSDLVLAVKTDYYLVLKSKKDLEVAKETIKRSEELLKLFEEKYQLGSASLSEVLKQKVQYGNDQLTLVSAEKNVRSVYGQLALDMGLDPQSEFDVADLELHRETVADFDALLKQSIGTHPTLLAAQDGLSASRYDVRSAWGWYLPNLSLSYGYSWGKDEFSELKKFGPLDHTGTLRLALSYNIFDGFTREHNMSRAKAGLSNARAQYSYVRNQVTKKLQDAYLAIKLADETLKLTEETERAAREDMDLVQMKYNLGAAALWELLDAQVSLKTAQFNKVKAEFDYNLALAGLQNAMGQ